MGKHLSSEPPAVRRPHRTLALVVGALGAIATAALLPPVGPPDRPAAAHGAARGARPVADATATAEVSDAVEPSGMDVVAAPLLAASQPRRLRIAAIGLDAGVEPVSLTAKGQLELPRNQLNAGWYAAGVRPGEAGDAVFAGSASAPSESGGLRRLHGLLTGDLVEVDLDDGTSLMFRVSGMAAYAVERRPLDLYSRSGPARLTMITGAGRRTPAGPTGRLYVQATLLTERDR